MEFQHDQVIIRHPVHAVLLQLTIVVHPHIRLVGHHLRIVVHPIHQVAVHTVDLPDPMAVVAAVAVIPEVPVEEVEAEVDKIILKGNCLLISKNYVRQFPFVKYLK